MSENSDFISYRLYLKLLFTAEFIASVFNKTFTKKMSYGIFYSIKN